MVELVVKESGEVLRMIRRGTGSEHDLGGRLKTIGFDIETGEYDGELSIFSYAIITGTLAFRNFHVRGNLDLSGLNISQGILRIDTVVVDGNLLLPKGIQDLIKISKISVNGELSWV